MENKNFKSGFVAIIGRPNAGKSTLLNRLLGRKLAIVSEKAQTTRNQIRGIYTDANMQVVFMDTPGVHKPKHKLDQRMMQAVTDSLKNCDLVLYLVDATMAYGKGEQFIMDMLAKIKTPVFLLLNKIDELKKDDVLPLIEQYAGHFAAREVLPISAVSGENCNRLMELISEYLPPGPAYYPDNQFTDQPEQLLVAELIREQVLHQMREEIPHSVAVTISMFEERPNDRLYIEANLYVERDSQKGMLIGKEGAMLKKIGTLARQEIERMLACGVYLELRVKTRKDWRNNESWLKSWNPWD